MDYGLRSHQREAGDILSQSVGNVAPAPERQVQPRPGTADVARQQMDRSYQAATTLNDLYAFVHDAMNGMFKLDCQMERLIRQREAFGEGGMLLQTRFMRLQELYEQTVERTIYDYGNPGTEVRRVSQQHTYTEERNRR